MIDLDSPGWVDILNQFWEIKTKQMWTTFPAKCIKYDKSKRRGDLEVLVKYLFGEETTPRKIPNLIEVPVILPGNTKATINLPSLGSGSYGVVIVCNIDISNWIMGSGQAVLPTEDRRWNINDGFFIPGVFPWGAPYDGTVDDKVLDINVVSGIKIKVGNGTDELLSLFNDNLTELITALKFLRDTITFNNGGGPTGPPTNASQLNSPISSLETTQSALGNILKA